MSLVVAIVTDLQQNRSVCSQLCREIVLFHGKAVPLGNSEVILLVSRNKVLVNSESHRPVLQGRGGSRGKGEVTSSGLHKRRPRPGENRSAGSFYLLTGRRAAETAQSRRDPGRITREPTLGPASLKISLLSEE